MIKPGDEPIPGYRVEELLGRGQFGQVWRARSPGQTSVALKFLELVDGHGWKEFRAIQRVKQIRHAHLMPIVAIWLLDDKGQIISDDALDSIAASHPDSYAGKSAETLVATKIDPAGGPAQMIVATLVANQSLGDRLKECQAEGLRGIPVDELLGYMEEAAKGLDFLNSTQHKIGADLGAVQHCDVKPENIMLTGGSVVISDFGVAQVLAQSRRHAKATSMGGTPAYMAPECFVNKPCASSDQYSLAVTYYELRTGELPFSEQTYAAVYQAHQTGGLDFSAASPAEQAVLRRATATESDNRFRSCSELVEKLQEAVHPKLKTAARRSVLALAGAALVGVLAAVVGWLVWRPASAPPAPAARVVVIVDPPDAKVTVDGKPVPMSRAGKGAFDAVAGRSLTIRASKPPERIDTTLKIEAAEGERTHKLALPFSAMHFAAEADELLAADKFDDAAAALAKAIELDAEQYASIPSPVTRLSSEGVVTCLQATADGRSVVAGTRTGAVTRWTLDGDAVGELGEPVHRQSTDVAELAVSDAAVATIGESADRIVLSRGGGDATELTVADPAARIAHIVMTGGGRWLVAATEVLELLPPARRVTALHAWDLQDPDVAATHKEFLVQEDEFEPLLAGAHEQDWVVLATSASGDVPYVVRQCPIESSDCRELHRQPGQVLAIAVSPDDRRIAVGGGAASDDGDSLDYRATLIDVASQQSQIAPLGHADAISTLAFDAAGDYLATGGEDGDAQAWTIPDDWTPARLLSEPAFMHDGKAPIRNVACPRAGWVVCAYAEKAALWDGKHAAHKPLWLPQAEGRITAIAATPDEKWIVTGHEDGSLRFWPAQQLMLFLRACITAGAEPKVRAEDVDSITRCAPPAWQDLDSLWGNAGSERRLPHRPSAAPAG